jgi:hypothetical protein
MEIFNLLTEESARLGGANRRIVLTHADLTTAAANTAQTIALFSAAAKERVKLIGFNLVTPFKDASDNAFNNVAIIVGDSDDDRYLASTQINENGTEILASAGTGTEAAYATATAINIIFGSMADKSLVDIDVGEIHLFFQVNALIA